MTTINAPRINTNDDKVEVVQWHVENGAFVEVGQEVVDIETSKAVVTLSAESEGFIRQAVERGAVVRVGAPLFYSAGSKEELETAASANSTPAGQPAAAAAGAATAPPKDGFQGTFSQTRFSKEATRLIQERGLSPADFQGAGLVTARMLEGRKASQRRAQTQAATAAVANRVEMTFPAGPETPRNDHASLAKQAEIQSLSVGEAGNINSMLTSYFDSAPIRARLLNDRAFDGQIQPLIIYEISRLLKQWPQFTAYFEEDRIHYYDRIDLGLAIDLGKGLKVVTIKDTDKLMPIDIFEKTIDFGLRYTENRIRSEELIGSTLTITDLSSLDILHFHPLINGRQSAIIGIGGDSTQPGHPMSISMTFDHRVANGREAGTFLKDLRARLLSYAAPEAPVEFDETAVAAPAAVTFPSGSANRCDTCGIDMETYHRDYGRTAYLLAYFRDDGTLGSVCHRCQAGWT